MSVPPPTAETALPVPADATGAVETLLREAARAGFSDLHLDPDEGGLSVRARRDGVLRALCRWPRELAAPMVGRLKTLAELLVYRTDLPQEGRIPREVSGVGLEVRVATYPTACGERVALRLPSRAEAQGLAELGLGEEVRAALAEAIAAPDGVLLLTGPSGSGKTSTLYACLRELVRAPVLRSIVTVEDPIEARIPGVAQTAVAPAAGLDFPRALRSLLRQDPDVILVGEIRDPETAQIALQAGLTGHLVGSTLHAGRAPLVFARLLDMGVEPFVLTTVVRGVLAQRLVRRLCGGCAGAGCEECAESGFRGRLPIASWLPMLPALRAAILARADGPALTAAAAVPDLWEDGRRLVAAGLTRTDELARILGPPAD